MGHWVTSYSEASNGAWLREAAAAALFLKRASTRHPNAITSSRPPYPGAPAGAGTGAGAGAIRITISRPLYLEARGEATVVMVGRARGVRRSLHLEAGAGAGATVITISRPLL